MISDFLSEFEPVKKDCINTEKSCESNTMAFDYVKPKILIIVRAFIMIRILTPSYPGTCNFCPNSKNVVFILKCEKRSVYFKMRKTPWFFKFDNAVFILKNRKTPCLFLKCG